MGSAGSYTHLFAPLQLGRTQIRNRIVMSPMGDRLAAQGAPTAAGAEWFARRARGGVGLVVVGGTIVHPTSRSRERWLYEAFDPAAGAGWRALAAGIHDAGARVVGQLLHRGREVADPAGVTWAPSAIRSTGNMPVPHAMSSAEITEVLSAYAASAALLIEAGFDGIEIHAAHGYLVGQFLSPLSNVRDDEYGGNAAARRKLLSDIITSVRQAIGSEPILGVRLSTSEECEGGVTVSDTASLASVLDDEGHVDYLNLAIGTRGHLRYVKDMSFPAGGNAQNAAIVRGRVKIPVICSQRIDTPELADQIIASGAADMVGIGRALIADADWADKARAGQRNQIVLCVACLQECRSERGEPRCLNNPRVSRESVWPRLEHMPRPQSKRVVVIGGGPGGLEAAATAAGLGHVTTLLEQSAELGGQARLAAAGPGRKAFQEVVRFRAHRLRDLGVSVMLKTPATVQIITELEPDLVIVATGAVPAPGPRAYATGPVQALTAWEFLELEVAGQAPPGPAVVIDDGTGDWEAICVLESLVAAGHNVTYVSSAPTFAAAIPAESRPALLDRLAGSAASILMAANVTDVSDGTVTIVSPGGAVRVAARMLIGHYGRNANCALLAPLAAAGLQVRAIGDCLAPRRMTEAILEGHAAARGC
jgi:2,4-dienoyl-CoA reductase (NADPH2)